MTYQPDRNIANLHPVMRLPVANLMRLINERALPFHLFEGYRSADRQQDLYEQVPAVTKAKPWSSAHQLGLAVDFVARHRGVWSWAETEPWGALGDAARVVGLVQPISWDRPHLEHPAYAEIRKVL